MRRLGLYYMLICLPIMVLVLMHRQDKLPPPGFGVGMLLYCLVYHPMVSGIRLIMLGLIKRREFWKNFIPGWNNKYFVALFFYRERKPARTDGWNMLRRMGWFTFVGSFLGGFLGILLNAEWLIIAGGTVGMIYYGYYEIRLVWRE